MESLQSLRGGQMIRKVLIANEQSTTNQKENGVDEDRSKTGYSSVLYKKLESLIEGDYVDDEENPKDLLDTLLTILYTRSEAPDLDALESKALSSAQEKLRCARDTNYQDMIEAFNHFNCTEEDSLNII